MTMLEKNEIKAAIREIMQEDKMFFKDLLQEIIGEPTQGQEPTNAEASRAERVDAIIRKDFERYKNVFKALA